MLAIRIILLRAYIMIHPYINRRHVTTVDAMIVIGRQSVLYGPKCAQRQIIYFYTKPKYTEKDPVVVVLENQRM